MRTLKQKNDFLFVQDVLWKKRLRYLMMMIRNSKLLRLEAEQSGWPRYHIVERSLCIQVRVIMTMIPKTKHKKNCRARALLLVESIFYSSLFFSFFTSVHVMSYARKKKIYVAHCNITKLVVIHSHYFIYMLYKMVVKKKKRYPFPKKSF